MKTLITLFCLCTLWLASTAASAEGQLPTLSANPFDRPDWLKSSSVAGQTRRAPKSTGQVKLRATLVAGQDSLAAVGDKIIGIGQEIYGYKLISVSNGAAVFSDGLEQLHVKVNNDEQDEKNEME
ncbi:MAG: hypothetical protein HKM98_09430 [Gammaproteobacteria bacterium]|nr:hypothetical protein [Gammaproteobacteria bacterium]